MRAGRSVLAAILFILALPLSGQEERAYFSLTSSRTYAPGEKPAVQVWANNVDALEFRVYRINDPVLFFRKLEDIHRFGGVASRLPGAQSWLERFHEWKRELRAEIRDLFRDQFTYDSRVRLRDWWAGRQRRPLPQPQATTYAQVPVLNPQQLVSAWRQPTQARRAWESETVPIDVPGKGVYLVEAVHQQLRAYTIIIVSDIGIITKSAPGRIVALVENRRTGEPLTSTPVLVWSNKKEALQAKTGADGLMDVRLDEERPENTLVLARSGEDFAVASVYSWYLSTAKERYWVGYVYTDRPVYRPGHTMNFKAILRNDLGQTYRLPDAGEVDVEVQDPDNNAVYHKSLPLSAAGTIHGDFTLSETAALGYYSIVIHSGKAEIQGGFHVEEYKKPEYEVRVNPDSPRILQGQPIQATIEARYYFGEPVAGAKVTYVVHASRYWAPFAHSDEEESSEEEEGGEGDYYAGEQILEQSGQLDAQGKLTISFPTKVSDHKWDLRYRIEARVTDAANREIAGRGLVLATYGGFVVLIRPDNYLYKPGDRARFAVEAKDYEGKPVATAFRIELRHWRWREEPGAPEFTTEGRTSNTGSAQAYMPLQQSGSYRVTVLAQTPEGREVKGNTYVWVEGGVGNVYGEARERVEIVPDKKSYRTGEVARVLIVTGVPNAYVLVTTEGRDVYTRQVVHAMGPSVTVEIPIRAEHEPNCFIGAVFLHDNQLYSGSKKLKVPPVDRQLTVDVQPQKPQFLPGEAAVYTVTTRNASGKPAPAEVSLGVVDESIYAIRPDNARDIVQFFYGETGNRVNTSTSLSYFFSGHAGKRAMFLAGGGGAARRADLAQLKPEHFVEPRVRKAFPDTAFWAAKLTTDSAGRAQVRFNFPDTLTTWRATARAVTRDTRVGNAVQRTVVRKNLILRLAMPRFFTEGDEVTISAVVHNYLEEEKKARVSLDVQGLDVLEGTTRDVSIPSRGETRHDWRVRAQSLREVKFLGKALTNEESDAVELRLPVVPFGVKLSDARAGSTTGPSAEFDAEMTFPAQSTPASRTLELSVSSSLAGAIFGALEYLTSYPYGCTEQTMSSFLPNVIVTKALDDLGVKSNVDRAALQKKVREGLQRLYDFQHEDGGWGWWQTDDSHAFMTAYVLAGLAQAQQAGYEVRPDTIERGRNWLRTAFDREKRAYPDLRAYLAYALVLNGVKDQAVLDAVWALHADLSPYGLALLGLAMHLSGDARAAQLAAQLESLAKADASEAYWPVTRDALMDFEGEATPEATAYAMKLLTALNPSSPLLPKAAAWLVNHRNEGFYWYSTKQTAMVVYGLIDYLRASHELQPNFNVVVAVNGKQVITRQFTAADVIAPAAPVLRIPAGDLAAGPVSFHIRKKGSGRLYWSVRAEYFSTEEKLVRTGTVSLNVLRDYFKLAPARENDKIVYRLDPLEGPVSPGDVLAVRLTVNGGDWRYLMIEDPIPAGTEFIERDDLYALKDRPPWWTTWYTRREFHDDRATFFQTYFWRSQAQYVYLLKVVTPGRFRVSPARVQPMYQPRYFATTESKVVEVK